MDISNLILESPSTTATTDASNTTTTVNITKLDSSPSTAPFETVVVSPPPPPTSPTNKVIPLDDLSMLADESKMKPHQTLMSSSSSSSSPSPSDLQISRETAPGIKNSILVDDDIFSVSTSSSSSAVASSTVSKPIEIQELKLEDVLKNNPVQFQISNDPPPSLKPPSTGVETIMATPSMGTATTTTATTTATKTAMVTPSLEDIVKEKQDLLFRLERYSKKGVPISRRYSMASSVEEIREEFQRIKSQKDLDNSVRFQRKIMMAFVSGVEFLNTKFDPFDVHLDGWSESVHENLEEYDEIFEELHEKYKEKAKMAPEIKLLMSLTGSAFMYHLSQSLFKSVLPSPQDILKQNPDLMRQFGQATMNSMNQNTSGFSQFMSNAIPQKYKEDAPRREMKGPSDYHNVFSSTTTADQQQQQRVSNIQPATQQDATSFAEQMKNIEINGKKPPPPTPSPQPSSTSTPINIVL